MIHIAVLGHGVVGSGVVEVLSQNAADIQRKTGHAFRIKYILDLLDFSHLPYAHQFVKDFSVIENDPEVSVVVEALGGIQPAFDFACRAIGKGKHVVTSNKELVALKGATLLQAAFDHGVHFLFEASVGGGIPIIRPLSNCLAGNEILSIQGILNGTTNFILTQMRKENMTFEAALRRAQELGYAERDPSADIEGHDTCRKMAILASLVLGHAVYPEQIKTQGIAHLTLNDLLFAQSGGYAVKLLGQMHKTPKGYSVIVSPVCVPFGHLLGGVEDVFNAVLVKGNAVGDVFFYGRGAGKRPTASAMVSDIIEAVKAPLPKKRFWDNAPQPLANPDDSSPYYMRTRGLSPSDIGGALGQVSFLSSPHTQAGELAFITPPVTPSQREDFRKVNEEKIAMLLKVLA